MKNITVGYFDLAKKWFLSSAVINDNFLDILSRYVHVKKIPLTQRKDLKKYFEEIEKYGFHYFYVDSYEALLEPFLLRERLRISLPFIVTLHAIFSWASIYAYVIPLVRKDDILLAPSKYAKESFSKISKKIKIHIMPNCLDVEHIRKNVSFDHKIRDKKTLVFMGRLNEKKGVGTLIGCMPELVRRAGDVHLKIVGPLSGSGITDSPKDGYVKKLEHDIKRLELTNRVELMGVRFGGEKYKILSEGDAFINPTTTREENFPMVNIEAMACSLPVIATDWAGNKEIIINGKNGCLVDVRDDGKTDPCVNVDRMVSSIVKVLTNPKINLKLREGAAKTAKKYDYRNIFPRLINLLKKVRSKKGNRWGLFKDKTIGQFSNLFNRDFLFFICAVNPRIRTETYRDIYKRAVEKSYVKKTKIRTIPKKGRSGKTTRDKATMNKISRDYADFLCLRKNICGKEQDL